MSFHILNLIIRGFAVGVFLALPTGPASFIIIRKTLVQGYRAGFIASLGTITTDLFYSSVVAFGIVFIESFLLRYNDLIRFACGVGLMIIAWVTWHAKFQERASVASAKFSGYLETLWISISNPILIVSTTGLFSAIGGPSVISARSEKLFFIAAIFVGGIVWWSLFLKLIVWLQHRNKIISLESINKFFAVVIGISGAVIFGYALFQVGKVAWEYFEFFKQFARGPFLAWTISLFR